MPDPNLLLAPLGGALLARSHSLISAATGRQVGIGGLVSGLADRDHARRTAALICLAAMLACGAALSLALPELAANHSGRPLAASFVGGALVGWGMRRANGCTTGHGISGLGRRRARSLVAVILFSAGAALAVSVWPAGVS